MYGLFSWLFQTEKEKNTAKFQSETFARNGHFRNDYSSAHCVFFV